MKKTLFIVVLLMFILGLTANPRFEWNDGFENHLDFAIAFEPWTLLDVDALPTYGLTNIEWTNAYAAQAFIIFNPANTTPATTGADAYEGAKYAACFNSVPAAGAYNNDWLITPMLNLGDEAAVTFMVKSFTSDYGLERFIVHVSTGSVDPADFTAISADAYQEAPIDWTEISYELTDYANQSIRIAIQCVSQDAFFLMMDDFTVTGLATAVDNDDNYQPGMNNTALLGNYPNPFNPETTISFNLKSSEHVSLDIFNVKGQKVTTIANGQFNQGTHNIVWNGMDASNSKIASGIYFYKLRAGSYTKTKKMILMK